MIIFCSGCGYRTYTVAQAIEIIKHHSGIKGIVFSLLDGKEKEAEQMAWDIAEPLCGVLQKKETYKRRQ